MSFFGGYLVVPMWKSKYMDDFDTAVNVYGEWLSCWKCGRFLNNLHYERSMPEHVDDPKHHYWADFARFADAVGWFAGFDAAGEWLMLCPVHNSERLSLLDDVRYGHYPIILKGDDSTTREQKIVTWLAGRDVNEADRFGRTPLMLARDNYVFVTKLLIELGANINAQNDWGNTALNYAVQKPAKTEDVVKYLLENGADVHLNAPIIYAERQFVPLLIEYGADVNQINDKGHFSLAVSALQQHYESLTYLVEHGANVNYINSHGECALACSVWKGDYDSVAYLLENGADPDFPIKLRDEPTKMLAYLYNRVERQNQSVADGESTEPEFERTIQLIELLVAYGATT